MKLCPNFWLTLIINKTSHPMNGAEFTCNSFHLRIHHNPLIWCTGWWAGSVPFGKRVHFLTRWRLIPWPEGIPNYLVSALQPTTSHSAANSLHSKMAGSQTCKRDKSKQVLFPLKSFSTKLLTLLNALLKERSKANLFNPKSLCCLWV